MALHLHHLGELTDMMPPDYREAATRITTHNRALPRITVRPRMTTEQLEDLEELGRRAVACKHWRWMPGMRTSEGWRIIRGSTESRCMAYDENPENWQVADNYIQDGTLPDLRDPATLGCLLALVREAYHAPDAYLMGSVTKQWVVHHFAEPEAYWKPLSKWQPTEAAALVAALEAAP